MTRFEDTRLNITYGVCRHGASSVTSGLVSHLSLLPSVQLYFFPFLLPCLPIPSQLHLFPLFFLLFHTFIFPSIPSNSLLLSSLLLFQLFFLAFFSPSISPTSHPFFPPFVSCSMSPSYFRLFVYPSMSAFIISSVILLYVLQPPG